MIVVVRLIGLLIAAAAIQLTKAPGIVAFLVAALAGWRRFNPLWIGAIALVAAALTQWLDLEQPAGGKAAVALSNSIFGFFVFLLIAGLGYILGRILRR